ASSCAQFSAGGDGRAQDGRASGERTTAKSRERPSRTRQDSKGATHTHQRLHGSLGPPQKDGNPTWRIQSQRAEPPAARKSKKGLPKNPSRVHQNKRKIRREYRKNWCQV